jgi:hypothetical protein
MSYRPRYPIDVNIQDWSQWPYVQRPGYPNVAAHPPWGYPTIAQTQAYRVYGHPPVPRRVNHLLHLVLTFFTVGFWIPVWFMVMIVVHNQNTQADANYWSRIQQYRQWELARQSANIPWRRESPRGG